MAKRKTPPPPTVARTAELNDEVLAFLVNLVPGVVRITGVTFDGPYEMSISFIGANGVQQLVKWVAASWRDLE